jgi:hypothetical protein
MLFIEPGSPWENGYVESFDSRKRDELLNSELFLYIDETQYVVKSWQMDLNRYRLHSSLSYMTPVGFVDLCHQAGYVRSHTPVFDGVQNWGILSKTLDLKKGRSWEHQMSQLLPNRRAKHINSIKIKINSQVSQIALI